MTGSPLVLLVTTEAHESEEPGHQALEHALTVRGATVGWAVWDDPFVDWAAADVVAVRTIGARHTREFLGWASGVGATLLHGAEVFRWNADRHYLGDLGAVGALPLVPTTAAATPSAVRDALALHPVGVVKPRLGRGRAEIVDEPAAWTPSGRGPWVVQPLVPSVFREGRHSVVVIAGQPVSQVATVLRAHDLATDSRQGGAVEVALDPRAALLAVDAVAAVAEVTGAEIVYARVDLARDDERLVVLAVDVTAPRLFLDLAPRAVERLAESVASRLGL